MKILKTYFSTMFGVLIGTFTYLILSKSKDQFKKIGNEIDRELKK